MKEEASARRKPQPAQGWSIRAFGEVATVDEGLVSPLAPPHRDLLHLGPDNIEARSGRILGPLRSAADLGLKSGKSMFDRNSIVYCKIRPGLNKVATPEFTGLSSADAYVIRPRHGVVSRAFLAYVMRAPDFVRQAQRVSMRTGMPKINRRELVKLNVPVPPLEIQGQVEKLLGDFDRALNSLHAMAAAKRRFKRGLVQELMTGKRRFKEFGGHTDFRRTAVGRVPTDWPIRSMAEVFSPVARRNDNGVTRVLTASGEHGLVDQRSFFDRKIAGADLRKYCLLRRGEYAYNRSLMRGYAYGAIKRLDAFDEGALSSLYLCFALRDDTNNGNFFAHFFESGALNSQLRSIVGVGARAHGLLNVARSEFFSTLVPVPSREEQDRIAELLGLLDREITLLERLGNALDRQRRGVAELLLTGKVRVPEAAS